MRQANKEVSMPLVTTIREKCRVCYTCIRECPAKAIRVSNGQAEIIPERCIGCGNCVRVCSQGAKKPTSSVAAVKTILAGRKKVAACLAPSFPAEFVEFPVSKLTGILRHAGFSLVIEVAAGADIVSEAYNKLAGQPAASNYISSSCPAVVSYIVKYFPHLRKHLAPVVSPMLATAMLVRAAYGEDVACVFIGPCIAKKREAEISKRKVSVDAVLTFTELREIISGYIDDYEEIGDSDFDPPRPGKGLVFPLGGGLLESASINDDVLTGDIISVDGTKTFIDIIKDFDQRIIDVRLVDVLCCNGCIMGPGFSEKNTFYTRYKNVSDYARRRFDRNGGNGRYRSLVLEEDLMIAFEPDDQRISIPSHEIIQSILQSLGKRTKEDELNCGACGYDTCIEHAIAIHKGLAEIQMCLPYTIEKFAETTKELSASYQQLASTQQALIQSEKLASMGQLAAGIAHELNNPLGVVLLYAHLLYDSSIDGSPFHDDLKMIVQQADRCKGIVAGLLNFARNNRVYSKRLDVNELIRRCLETIAFPETITVAFPGSGKAIVAEMDEDQMMQVFINLFTNASEAMPEGGVMTITTALENNMLSIAIADNGIGIKEENRKKIFEPFFTTKQLGKGTGLGLAVVYGIIKMHRGNIEVTSNADRTRGGTGTTFTILLPQGEKPVLKTKGANL
ncbi:MAG: 4Fe-4S binding protein [Spirochaetales bacterium]|nr:4Fe-4S binding protein [Spirochaetales bacterium]